MTKKTLNLLVTGKLRGPTNALNPVCRELERRGHSLAIYATGNKLEGLGFKGLNYSHLDSNSIDFNSMLNGLDGVVVGLSGIDSPDMAFLKEAKQRSIPVVALQEQNTSYSLVIDEDSENLPDAIGLVLEASKDRIRVELNPQVAEELIKRSRVVGFTAYDAFQRMKDEFAEEDRERVLTTMGLNPTLRYHLHFSRNILPHSKYMQSLRMTDAQKSESYEYEVRVTRAVFKAARDLELHLIERPHPGEDLEFGISKRLSEEFGFYHSTEDLEGFRLMLSASSVSSVYSGSIGEATILDRPTAGIVPDMPQDKINLLPALGLNAVPYSHSFFEIPGVLKHITSPDEQIQRALANQRKVFSTDGKATLRFADLVEEVFM